MKFIEKLQYKIKMFRNLSYIERNYKIVLKKLQKKIKSEKLKVVFYVYDETKWKCQSLYDLLDKDSRFEVEILVSKTSPQDTKNPSYQTIEDVKKTFDFFASKGLNVRYAYDIDSEKFIPFEDFAPDIIIYQHPWYVETSQGPVVCSKFALTAYVPYYFPTTIAPIDYYLRFHRYIQNYYIFDDLTYKVYKENMENKGKNLKVVGQPFFDYFRNIEKKENKYTIYAPHWTVCQKGVAYATFEWNGDWILEYAKKHPERNWVFKPHPLLYKALVDNNIKSPEEVREYYDEWDKIGIKYESGDYLDLFNASKMLITDCSSFLGEYFLTENPVIHLISSSSIPFNKTVSQVIENYYKAHNLEELQKLLEELPQNDWMKSQRVDALKKLGFKNNYAAENILNDLLNQLEAV
ncbi:CDP-glycerol glycerophosphotransferase family protein [bacterium]|nr:CDP-glycerol glycerophosphotransferase family protein [bacterium]